MGHLHNGILIDRTKRKRKRKFYLFAAVWMDLENIMLSEINQSEKDKYHVISFICGV